MNRLVASDGPARTPGTGVRILLFLLTLSVGVVLLFLGFPAGAPDRLPALIIALVLALVAAARGDRGATAFSFLFPCTGLLVRFFGGSDPIAWPVLLFAGLLAGWTFRFVYDFESARERSPLDGPLAGLSTLWLLGTALALARARTLWAVAHGLAGRAVNVAGLPDSVAIRETVFALSSVGAGAAFFFLLRRSGAASRRRCANAALLGVGISAAASVLQRTGALPPEASPFWRMSGRLSGGAADPNSLGLLCALAMVFAVVAYGRSRQRRGLFGLLVAIFIVGLFLSGSRSGFLLVLLAVAALLVGRRLPNRFRMAVGAAGVAAILAAALLVSSAVPGTLGRRVAQTFDPSLSMEQRISARPLLWSCAGRLFLENPLAGVGLGAFSWRLPDALAGRAESLAVRDNPGSAYVQALAETGLPGLVLTIAFAWPLARAAARRIPHLDSDPEGAGSGAAVLAFLLALVFGSHWFAPDVCLLFFLFAAIAAEDQAPAEPRAARLLRWVAVATFAAAAVVSALATARPEETFRYDSRIGFYGREVGPAGAFRWTRKRFALRLEPGEQRRLALAHYTPEAQPVAIEASVDGSLVYEHRLVPGEAVALRLSAPPDRARIVLLRLSRSFVPKRLGFSDDRRELGLLAQMPE
jgi:O-antigen ligase